MKIKTIKFCSLFLYVLLIFQLVSAFPISFSNKNETLIVKDSDAITGLPNRFRDLTNLNISGSAQFTPSQIENIKNSINKPDICIVDLRQESHGFINGIAISFENEKNNANKGLSLSEVLSTQDKLLDSIKIGIPITFYNTKETIVPKSVQNELQVANSKEIGYIHIPVTDGGIPTDDMVNYFIDFVKNQPKDSWLHFHCKEGIGRTTTFLIMYDIMKNHKDVNLNDIIKRQVLLSGMSDTSSQGFYEGNHNKFLTDFYNNYESKSTSSIRTDITNNQLNDYYIKNSIIPKHLYVISEDHMSKEEQTMISALQGIISTKSNSQIYILNKNEPDYKIWLDDLNKNYNICYENISDPWKLLNKFKSTLKGYILYSNSNPSSINNACSLSSLKDALPIEESLEVKVNNYDINTLIKNCRDTNSYWAYENLWNSGLNHSTVIQLSPDKSMALRDYAIMSKSLIFYEDNTNDTTLREQIFNSMDETARCLGWGPDEFNNVSIASKYGVDVITADWSYNLSVLSSFNPTPQTQTSQIDVPEDDNVHYVTFIMSDGDNQQWLLGSNYSSEKWYGSKNRGNFNLGWTLSPSLYYLAPTVFNKYYESAILDYYLVSPSGNGYIYPSKYPQDKLINYTNRLNEYMKKVDQKYVVIIDDNSFYDIDLWDKYTSCSNIDGLFYLDYKRNNNYKGEIIWSNNKPIVSCRDLLWDDLENEDELIKNINSRANLDYIGITNPESYTFVYIHVWSKDMDNLQNVINKLNSNSKIKIVSPDIFIRLIKNNINS